MVNNTSINVCTFNCKYVQSSVDEIKSLCKKCDVLLLQETWLLDSELPYLSNISDEFYAKGISSVATDKVLQGRKHGGIGILWRKNLTNSYKILDVDERIMGIQLKFGDKELLILNVYMPYCCSDNYDDYILYLSKLNNIVTQATTSNVIILGDFNGDVTRQNGIISHAFGKVLAEFCEEEKYIISDVMMLEDTAYTYYSVSDTRSIYSWVDHVITTVNSHHLIDKMCVLYECVTSDHHPILVKVKCDQQSSFADHQDICKGRKVIRWNDLSKDRIATYTERTESLLSHVTLNHDLLLCDSVTCTDPSHTAAITTMYNDIVNILKISSECLCDETKGSYKQIPGWNDYCKAAHSDARNAYLLWINSGKPRYGYLFEQMKKSRSCFKRVIRQCKRDTDRNVANSIAKHLLCKDDKGFWKEIKKINNGNQVSLANCIDGISGHDNIANKWKTHFSNILNSSKDTSSKRYVLDKLQDRSKLSFVRFTAEEVAESIKDLKNGKTSGLDLLYGEHFKYAHAKVNVLLALVFNCMIIHSFMPDSIMDTILVPLVKDKKCSLSDSDNYRPLAITCVASKILELLILERYSYLLQSTDNQFGFKRKHATDLCVFTLKQVIEYYRSLNSAVHICFLDASKAFDKVNHWKLFEKLLYRNVPYIIVRLLMVWYCTQIFYVRWGSTLSTGFNVSNGVRQGGILSPILFNVFMNDLSVQLNGVKTGCHINDVPYNHLFYADDSVLLAPTPFALQKLLDICDQFAKTCELVYNTKKTFCMSMLPKWLKEYTLCQLYLDGKKLDIVNVHKYLGMKIRDDMYDDADIAQQVRATYARGNVLISKFRKCDNDVKVKLFKTFCSSFYGCNLWVRYHKFAMRKLVRAYERIFRQLFIICDQSDTVNVLIEMNADPVEVILRKIAGSFYRRILSSENRLLVNIVSSLFFCDSPQYKMWEQILF